MAELAGTVTWEVDGEPALRTLIKLGGAGPSDALRPVWAAPIVLEWPQLGPLRPNYWMRVVVASTCDAAAKPDRTIAVRIPAADAKACVAEARMTGGDDDWCTRAMSEDATYVIREYHPFSHGLWHRARVAIEPEEARLELDGAFYRTRNTRPIRDLLEPIWQLSPETK